jgi:protein TIF31
MHEMVSRAAKHVFSRYLRRLPLLDVPDVVAHLLNCLVGFKVNSSPQVLRFADDEFSGVKAPEWTCLDAKSMQAQIGREVLRRYRYHLEDNWWNQCKCIVLTREVCLKMGFQLKARDFIFEKPEIMTYPGKSKKLSGTNGHKVEETTFYPEDILNVVPIVKEAPLKV